MLLLSADFQGELITSYIDGTQVLHFPSHRRTVYVAQSCVGVSLLLALALGVVVSIYLVRFSIEEDIGIANAQLVASALNATQIQVLNYCYRHILTQLTNRENHRTETQVGALICFLLYCIISYSIVSFTVRRQPDCENLCVLVREFVRVFLLPGLPRGEHRRLPGHWLHVHLGHQPGGGVRLQPVLQLRRAVAAPLPGLPVPILLLHAQ